MSRTVSMRGSWPDAVVLRAGWWKAHARPINDDGPDASLRLERGGSDFLRACSHHLFRLGVPAVTSVPLHAANRRTWEQAGFRPYRQLTLLERDLSIPVGEPGYPLREGRPDEWGAVAEVDRAAFEPEWRIGRLGLMDAKAATARSSLLVAERGGEVVGFVISGVAYHTGYLQRIAVSPEAQGAGIGRAMVRAALRWARSLGARSMLLNTQPDNREAAGLYRSERFEQLPERLALLRMTAGTPAAGGRAERKAPSENPGAPR